MNSSIGKSAETKPPFVSFGFSFRAKHRGCAAACLFGLALLLGTTQALTQVGVSLVSNIYQSLKTSGTSVLQDAATKFVTGRHAQGIRYLSETGGGALSLSLRPHWGIATDGAAVL
ncbi:MAG: hypothetical protein F4082_07490 [Gammaproteobacteria bacterium]|nr:hypothetical protein [Gammaproteobacteria bacterium]